MDFAGHGFGYLVMSMLVVPFPTGTKFHGVLLITEIVIYLKIHVIHSASQDTTGQYFATMISQMFNRYKVQRHHAKKRRASRLPWEIERVLDPWVVGGSLHSFSGNHHGQPPKTGVEQQTCIFL